MKQLSIIGAGSWGCALAQVFIHYYDSIHLWCYCQQEKDKLPSVLLNNPVIKPSFDIMQVADSQAILLVVPSDGFNQSLLNIKPFLSQTNQYIAWASKGFDVKKSRLLHQCFSAMLSNHSPTLISGPSFASEVLAQKPTALVVSSQHNKNQIYWATALQGAVFIRAYMNHDLIGAEIGGAVKNVMAIAAGIISALDYGANTQAALITRGLSEMMRLGVSLGANTQTFMGLTGLGDLVLTCSDDLSRNRQFGRYLTQLGDIQQAQNKVGSTIEGLQALKTTLIIAKKQGIEMPICEQVYQVIYDDKKPQDAIKTLMQREMVLE